MCGGCPGEGGVDCTELPGVQVSLYTILGIHTDGSSDQSTLHQLGGSTCSSGSCVICELNLARRPKVNPLRPAFLQTTATTVSPSTPANATPLPPSTRLPGVRATHDSSPTKRCLRRLQSVPSRGTRSSGRNRSRSLMGRMCLFSRTIRRRWRRWWWTRRTRR